MLSVCAIPVERAANPFSISLKHFVAFGDTMSLAVVI
jgi:hypothetical protein